MHDDARRVPWAPDFAIVCLFELIGLHVCGFTPPKERGDVRALLVVWVSSQDAGVA